MELFAAGDLRIFAFYAGAAGALTALGLVRDRRSRVIPPALREGMIAPLGLVALAAAMAMDASQPLRLLAGALLLSGLALLAVAPRRTDRPSPGRQVGLSLSWVSIAVALTGAFIPALLLPHSPA